MSEFERTYQPIDFGETDDSPIEIVLKFKDDFEGTWERNENNTLRFSEMKRMLAESRTCYFQKIKKYNNTDKYGNVHSASVHRIIFPIEAEKAIELQCSLNRERIDEIDILYSYFVKKAKEIVFITAPNKDVEPCICYFTEYSNDNKGKGRKFTDFYKKVDALNIPTIDLNKEKDRKIWDNYVNALKKLVKQKEIVWKIKDITNPYTDNNGSGEKSSYVDIEINEDDLNKKFEENIEDLFSENDLSDYAVNKDTAFIEFDTYRVLSSNELLQLEAMASEYFFEKSTNTPTNEIIGELTFKYTNDNSKEDIYHQIQQKLSDDYEYDELVISSFGEVDITEEDYPHLKKCVEDNFSGIAYVERRNDIVLKINVETETYSLPPVREIQKVLVENGLNHARPYISKDSSRMTIEVAAPVQNDLFSKYGLQLQKAIYRFGNKNNNNSFDAVDGFDIVDGEYQTSQRFDFKAKLTEIQDQNEDLTIHQLPTRYIFAFPQQSEKQTQLLRNIKTKTDLTGKSTVEIRKSAITITADSDNDYKKQLQRIKTAVPNIELENKPYKPSFFVRLNSDIENFRKSVVANIQNDIRKHNLNVDYDPYRNYTRIAFSYKFNTEEERETFKKIFKDECSKYDHLLIYSFENELGHTTYQFEKNKSLECEREKENYQNVRMASFVFLNKEQYEILQKKIEEEGDNAYFKDWFQIGTLVRKERNKLKFRIKDDFEDYMVESHKNVEDLKNGFIKPIFPGELANIGRMIRAMAKVTTPGKVRKGVGKIGYPANPNLPNFLFDPNYARTSLQDLEETKQHILSNLNEPLLKNQPKQLEAVAKALIATDMALIQGPPGTGKTTVIAEIIWQTLLLTPESKILVTSQTNLAVDNALERLRGKKLVRPIRIGNIEKFEDEGKIYSNERMQQWLEAKNLKEENDYKNNAICDWINCIGSRCSDDSEYSEIVSKWKKGLASQSFVKDIFAEEYFKHVNVFAATCSECGSGNFATAYQSIFQKNQETKVDPIFDVVIMDEASKATPPELVLPLTLGKKVIIIGDHKQLPPMLDEKEFGEALEAIGAKDLIENWTKEDYKTSQFEKLFVNAPIDIVASLDTQFRMHEQIMNCISQFYKDQEELENGLICGITQHMDIPDFSDKASRWHGLTLQPFIEPKAHAIWVNVETPEIKTTGMSYANQGEIDAIKIVLRALTRANGFKEYMKFFKKDEDKEIGVITYYMPQMNEIRKQLYQGFSKEQWKNFEQHKYENEFQIPFRINTVDRFQGMERNIIIVSTVRSNIQIDENGKQHKNITLGFAKESQRVNVGFSRAKRLLIVVGNEKHFARKPEYAEAISKMHRIDVKQLKNL